MHHRLLWTTKVSIPREIYTFLSHWTVTTKSKPTQFSLSGLHTPQPRCCQMGETNKLLNQFLTNEMFASRTKRLLQRDQCKNECVKYATWLKSRRIRLKYSTPLQSTMTSSQTWYIGGHADSDLNTATEESRHMMITMSLEGDWAKLREVRMVDFARTDADIQLCFILWVQKAFDCIGVIYCLLFCILIYGLVMYKTDSASYFWYSILCDSYIVSFTCYVGFLTVHWDSKISLLVFLYL